MAVQYGITARRLLDFSYSSQPWQSFFPAHNLLVKASEKLVAEMETAGRHELKAG
jgi:NADH dehydrogenase/NADH oxidase (H2O2-forming)